MPITLKQQHISHSSTIGKQNISIKNVLQTLKQQSQLLLIPEQVNDIDLFVKQKQSTTYEIMLLGEKEYISHQFTKLQNKEMKKNAIDGVDLMTNKFLLDYQLGTDSKANIVVKNLLPDTLSIHQRVKSKLAGITGKMDGVDISRSSYGKMTGSDYKTTQLSKSQSLNSNQRSFNNSTSLHLINDKLTQKQLENMMQFKQRNHWLKSQQKSQQVKQFLQHHRRQKASHHQRYTESLSRYQQRAEQQQRIKAQNITLTKKQLIKQGLQRTLQYKQKRQNRSQSHENQLQNIESFLEKINPTNKRLYKQLEHNYKQQLQKERQIYNEKLAKIKEKHAPLEQQQLQEHRERYQEYKESLKEELRTKKDELAEHLHEVGEELRALYKSRQYDMVAENEAMSPSKRSLSEIIQRKAKNKQFSLKVKDSFKPHISQSKREELQQSIRLLELTQDKSKRKVYKNGELEFEEKEQGDPRKKGIEYLAYLRKYLENKPHKDQRSASTSLVQHTTKVKRIDYLRENKPNIRLKASLQQWKQVINDPTFNAKDKYTFLKESVSTLEHRAFDKEIQARNLKKSPQELQKKEQFDKLYLESIEAKMAILNDLMLGRK